MKPFLIIVIVGIAVILMSLTSQRSEKNIGVTSAVAEIKFRSEVFAQSTSVLEKTVFDLNIDNPRSVILARNALKNCRYNYKYIEYFLEYFFESSAHIYNSPAKYEVEESELEYQEPIGFQVMEDLLYHINGKTKQELLEQAKAINTSARDINSLLYNFQADDKQLLESVRLELIRVMTLGITGYDAPDLKSGIKESACALQSLQSVLQPFIASNSYNAKKVSRLLDASIFYLKSHPDFDKFNRLEFLADYALPLQQYLNLFIHENQLELNTTGVLNYKAANLFSKKFFKVDSFYKDNASNNTGMIALGKRLFFEKSISGNSMRNCASCHNPNNYFTDGLVKSATVDGRSTIKRNTPTLLYAAYQYSQDWDGRARSLEDQVRNVMNNKDEMNADTLQIIKEMQTNKSYTNQFGKAFHLTNDKAVTIRNLTVAIAAYLRTLAPFNSAFDRYIRGEKKAMTAIQINGFNLFMGKAQCGTCHFAPLFNGLTPPGYKASEYEILGVPLSEDFIKPKYDIDSGRYSIYPTKYYNGAFKTPTVRNAAKTSPYMHNGSFHSLQKVLDFYNKGGGNGIGLNIPEQTLSSTNLKLSGKELNEIRDFIGALTDGK